LGKHRGDRSTVNQGERVFSMGEAKLAQVQGAIAELREIGVSTKFRGSAKLLFLISATLGKQAVTVCL